MRKPKVKEIIRPNPDALLDVAKKEDSPTSGPAGANAKRGKLTIFFGASPGVGKTFRMLTDARGQKAEGKDLVIGYVEPHGRKETESLADSIEKIPLRAFDYKGIVLSEPDVDAILKRKPEIVLIDELAHTNAKGSRHVKRYQDVEELLNAGIDVWTTLNAQHLESLRDNLYEVIGIRIAETIPDTVVLSADEIKLVDLPPEELLKRLKDGKIYLKDMAAEAQQHFFKPANLLALREITLRLTAARVSRDMNVYIQSHAVAGAWPTKERLLVGIRPVPMAETVVRAAFQLATAMDAEWIALYVETARHPNLSEQEHEWLSRAMDTAKTLGAKRAWVKGEDFADEVAAYAQTHHATKIVLGKPRFSFALLSPAQKVIANTDADVFLIAPKDTAKQEPNPISSLATHHPLGYAFSVLAVLAASLVGFWFRSTLSEVNLLFLFFIPTVLSALFIGRGASFLAAMVSIVLYDYLFIPPYYTFSLADLHYVLTFTVYVAVVMIISNLAKDLRFKVEQVQKSENRTNALYGLSRDLVTARTVEQALGMLVRHTQQLFPCETAVFMPAKTKLFAQISTPGFQLNNKELALATWTFVNGKPSGQGMETLGDGWAAYLPLKTAKRTIGVAGFHFDKPDEYLTAENKDFLETLTDLTALAIENLPPASAFTTSGR